ncbi:MAG: hypothetical protein KF705_02440 [Phycisphaeraceae bacterium]|nr:hypothetical protein [Phycisphaeraceae bacterium]
MALAGQIEFSRFTDMVAERLRLNLEYDPALLTGSVSIRTEQGLSDVELWHLYNGVLATRSLTTVLSPSQSTYRIVRISDAATVAPVLQPGATLFASSFGPGYLSVIVRASHRPAQDLVEPLSKVITKPSGSVTALGGHGSQLLLISDLASRVEHAVALIEILDTPSEGVVVVEVPVVNISADQMAVTFAQVVAKRDAVAAQPGITPAARSRGDVLPGPDGNSVLLVSPPSEVERWKALITSLDRRERIDTITYTPRHYAVRDVAPLIEQTVKNASDDRWKLVIDELTGSLLITATPSQHASVQALLDRLDDAPAAARRPVRTFVIKNRSVMEIQSILENLLRSGVLDTASDPAMGGDLANQRALSASGASQSSGVDVMAMPPVPSDDRSRSGITTASDVASGSTHADLRRGDAARRRVSQDRTGSVLQDRSSGSGVEDRPLILSSDGGTNTLIAVGEPRLLAQVESLLVSLDVRQPQVMLKVLIVTLTESQTLDLGVGSST